MIRQEIPSFPNRMKGAYLRMLETSDLKNVAENINSFYDKRIESITSIFDTSLSILSNFPESITNIKEEREKIGNQIRDILAHNEHLRKKDFDCMTQGILSVQEEREAEVKNLLKGYLNQQREMARTLRENLAKFKDALTKGDVQRVKEFHEMIKEILANQDARKEDVTFKLKEVQKEQQEMAKRLKELLAKGGRLRTKDLKSMLLEFSTQHKERLAHREERRQEVNKMIDTFKQERKGAAKNWQVGQIRDKVPEAIHPVRNSVDADKKANISNGVNIHVKRNGRVEEEVEKLNKITKRRESKWE